MNNLVRILIIFLILTLFVPPLMYWCWVALVRYNEGQTLKTAENATRNALAKFKDQKLPLVIFGVVKDLKENKQETPKYIISDLGSLAEELPDYLLMQNTPNTTEIQFLVYKPSRFRNFIAQGTSGNGKRLSLGKRLNKQFKSLFATKQQRMPIGAIVIERDRVLRYAFPLHKLISQAFYIPGEYPESIIIQLGNHAVVERLKLKESAYINTPFFIGNRIEMVVRLKDRVLFKADKNYYALDQRSGTVNQLKDFGKLLPGIIGNPYVVDIPGKSREQLYIANTTSKGNTKIKTIPEVKGIIYDVQGDFAYLSSVKWHGSIKLLGKSKITGIHFAIANLNLEQLLKRNNRNHTNYLLELDTNSRKLYKLAILPINLTYDPDCVFIEKSQLMLTRTKNGKDFQAVSIPNLQLQKTQFHLPTTYKLSEMVVLNWNGEN